MKKPTFINFILNEKLLFLLSIIIITPYNLIFTMASDRFIEDIRSQSRFATTDFFISYLYPLFIGVLIVISITYILSIKNQIMNFNRYIELSTLQGAKRNLITRRVIMYFVLINVVILILMKVIGIFNIYSFIIPIILLIISIGSLFYYSNKLM